MNFNDTNEFILEKLKQIKILQYEASIKNGQTDVLIDEIEQYLKPKYREDSDGAIFLPSPIEPMVFAQVAAPNIDNLKSMTDAIKSEIISAIATELKPKIEAFDLENKNKEEEMKRYIELINEIPGARYRSRY